MITVKLMGGLGNVMFEYALGRRLALQLKTDLTYDITPQKANKVGDYSYSLEVFNIEIHGHLMGPYRRWWRSLIRRQRMTDAKERHFHFDPELLNITDETCIEGWVQSPKYFDSIRDTLLKDFAWRLPPTGKNKDAAEHIARVEAVALHIRRGDYVRNPKTHRIHGSIAKQYYDDALALIAKTHPTIVLFIFSDEPAWVAENWTFPYETHYIDWNDRENGHEDMRLMSLCKHNVIANSTFSWWGAWLNTHPNKIVVAPSPWFNNANADPKDLIPAEWIKIESHLNAE